MAGPDLAVLCEIMTVRLDRVPLKQVPFPKTLRVLRSLDS